MTNNEAIELMKSLQISKDCELVKTFDFKATVIKALEDLQQYRAIGTVEEIKKVISFLSRDDDNSIIDDMNLLNQYRAIGTVEQLRACTIIDSGEYPYWNGYKIGKQLGYNKAIEEFAERLRPLLNTYHDQVRLDEIAEEMRGSEENETNRC